MRALIHSSKVGRLMNQIALVAEMPVALLHVRRSPDPHDDFLLGLCEARHADWLLTSNQDDLLPLEHHHPISIMTAVALAEQWGFMKA